LIVADSENWVTVTKASAVGPGEVIGVALGDREFALYNLDGDFYATDGLCTHAFALLSQGWLDGDVIECPLHGGRFEVKTGKGIGPPVSEDIKIYPVRIQGDDLQIRLD
jgi:nitrite reductase/ring-hydroxylating ferredoxin subunit